MPRCAERLGCEFQFDEDLGEHLVAGAREERHQVFVRRGDMVAVELQRVARRLDGPRWRRFLAQRAQRGIGELRRGQGQSVERLVALQRRPGRSTALAPHRQDPALLGAGTAELEGGYRG
jgi:hypothetical protein